MIRKVSFLLIVTLLFVIGCGVTRYGDLRSVMEDSYAANEEYIKGLESAKSPQDVAAAVNKFSDRMETLAPRIKEVRVKYPEVDMKSNKYPAELGDLKEKSQEQGKRMMSASMKMTQYIMNPEVMKSFQRLTSAMMKMQ